MPYSNQADVLLPFGLTDPFRVADVSVIPEADRVVTVGPEAGVRKLATAPQTGVPPAHCPHVL